MGGFPPLMRYRRFYRLYGAGGVKYLRDITRRKSGLIEVRFRNLRHPVYLRPHSSDIDTFRECIIKEEYSIKLNFTPRTLMDLGANTGLATVFFKQRYPGLEVACVEPSEANFALLRKNLAPYDNVHLYHNAIWPTNTRVAIEDMGEGNFWGFRVRETTGTEGIPTRTVGGLMDELGWDSIDILKVDIEGAEKELFSENFEPWLSKTKVIIIEFHDRFRKGTSKAFMRAVNDLEFRMQTSRENVIFYMGDSADF